MKPYQALIWNEWRQMRGIVLAAAGAMVLLWLTLFVLSMLRISNIDEIAFLILSTLPMLLTCIGVGTFQGEFKNQTDNFLLSLPISRGKIFWYKYLFNLSLYILLVVLCYSLFFPLTTDPPPIKQFITEFIFTSSGMIFAAIFLSLHAVIVATPLLQNRPGGKVGGWAGALAFPALIIGIQSIVSLYPCSGTRWIGVIVFIVSFITWLSALGMGYYLWTNYIALKRDVMRPLLTAAGATVVFSAILFTSAYIYSGLDLAAAKRDAQAAGLILESKTVTPPTPEAKKDAFRILEALQQYQAKLNAVKPKLPSQLSINGKNYNWLNASVDAQLSLESMQQAASFILDDPTSIKLYAELCKVLNTPSCRFGGTALMQKVPGASLTGIDLIKTFLQDRAYALELRGRTQDAFECLEFLDKLSDAISNLRNINILRNNIDWIALAKFMMVINIGPDTLDEVKYYQKLLQELDAISPQFYDETGEILKYNDDFLKTSQWSSPRLLEIGEFLLTPLYRESLASFLCWQTAYKRLFDLAATVKFEDIKPAMENLVKQYSELPTLIIPPTHPHPVKRCYKQRSEIAAAKLYLALKIYKAKYGKFPETLAKLSPEILPVIPLNPISGENFEYHASPNGFSMNTESFELRTKMEIGHPVTYSHDTFSYHTWKIATEKAK